MVYTSLSLSLAAIEVFVHLDPAEQPGDLVSLVAELPVVEQEAERVEVASLPRDWRKIGHPALQRIGQQWVRAGRSLALLVPSAATDGEWNVLVNPMHADAGSIRLEAPRPFRFDERMFR
jgi:RES domain-containing protein